MIEIGLFILMVSISILMVSGLGKDSMELFFTIPFVRLGFKFANKENSDGHQSSLQDK